MERGALAPLSPNEEVTLRRIAIGIAKARCDAAYPAASGRATRWTVRAHRPRARTLPFLAQGA